MHIIIIIIMLVAGFHQFRFRNAKLLKTGLHLWSKLAPCASLNNYPISSMRTEWYDIISNQNLGAPCGPIQFWKSKSVAQMLEFHFIVSWSRTSGTLVSVFWACLPQFDFCSPNFQNLTLSPPISLFCISNFLSPPQLEIRCSKLSTFHF